MPSVKVSSFLKSWSTNSHAIDAVYLNRPLSIIVR